MNDLERIQFAETAMDSANLHSNAAGGDDAGLYQEGVTIAVAPGHSRRPARDQRLFRGTDITLAEKTAPNFSATADSVMSPAKAAEVTSSLLAQVGLDKSSDAIRRDFVDAMCLAHAINGGSTLAPGRAEFVVGGRTFNFFNDVAEVLGNDNRRYFRAYADNTRLVLTKLKSRCDKGEEASVSLEAYLDDCDAWDHVVRVASDKGLSRVPHLVHDSSDFCTGLTSQDRMYLKSSKASVIPSVNVVDNPMVLPPKAGGRVGAVPVQSALDSY